MYIVENNTLTKAAGRVRQANRTGETPKIGKFSHSARFKPFVPLEIRGEWALFHRFRETVSA